jgi:hypothetical protein
VKLLRTIRLDPSDTFVFDRPAEPAEWAVAGTFVFWNSDPAALDGKTRAAFRSGFLGVSSLGWSTLAKIVDASAAERTELVELLASRLIENFGAPDMAAARTAAADEVNFVESLCSEPRDTLIAVHRRYEDGTVRESFRTLRPRQSGKPGRVFDFFDVDGEDEPSEAVDLRELVGRERK